MPTEDLRKFDSLCACLTQAGGNPTTKKKRQAAQKADTAPVQCQDSKNNSTKLAGARATLSKFGAFIVYVSAIVGITVGYLSLPPKVRIDPPTDLFEESDPLSGFFKIRNDGNFSIYGVRPACYFAQNVSTLNKRESQPSVNFSYKTIESTDSFDKIEAGKSASVSCRVMVHFPVPLKFVQLVVEATFRPSILYWKHTTDQVFVAKHNRENKWRWFPIEKTSSVSN
jgi:hypothetical protein